MRTVLAVVSIAAAASLCACATDEPALIGAWVLIVYYGEGDRVTSVQSKFDWGFGHMTWDGRYRR